MEDNVFAEARSEGAPLEINAALDRFSARDDKTSSESQTGTKETDKPSQRGDNTPAEKTPFHKHPRWIQTQRELKELREETARLKSLGGNQPAEAPGWWKKQYGDTPESNARYQAVIQKDGELDWIKQQIKEDLRAETQAEQRTIQDGQEYVDTQLQEMTDEGIKFERNKLLKFMVDYQNEFGGKALLDDEGNYDFRKSLRLMNRMQPEEETPNVAKQVAAAGGRGKGNTARSTGIPIVNRNVLRRGNWRDADTGQFTSR